MLWKKNIWTDFGGKEYPRWAIAQNPLVYQNMVIVASQTEAAGIVAYEKESGNIIWKTPKLQGNAGYVSPAVVKLNGEDHLIMVTASGMFNSPDKGSVSGFNPKTGALIWSFDGWQCGIPVPNVTQISKNRIFITAGYGAGGTIMEINKNGDFYVVKEILHTKDFETHAHPAILYKEHLYGHCTNNTGKMDGFICMDLEGNIKWKTGKKPFFDKGGMILVDDMIISSDGEKMLYLIEPDPAGFKVLAQAELLGTKQSWGPLTLSDGKLVIRDQKQMKCILLK